MADPFIKWLGDSIERLYEYEPARQARYQQQIGDIMGGSPFAQTRTPAFQQYWQNQYPEVFGQYMGKWFPEYTQHIETGQPFTGSTWGQYMENFPFYKQWQRMAPYQRGERPSTFAPRMRWAMY